MADEQIDIAALRAIRDQYAGDVEKADRDFEKTKEKLALAKNRLQVANDMIAKLTGGKEGTHKPLGEEILRIIAEANGIGLSAKDIREKFLGEGFHVELAAIHVTADRLRKKGLIELVQGADPRTKLFRAPSPKTGDSDDSKP